MQRDSHVVVVPAPMRGEHVTDTLQEAAHAEGRRVTACQVFECVMMWIGTDSPGRGTHRLWRWHSDSRWPQGMHNCAQPAALHTAQ